MPVGDDFPQSREDLEALERRDPQGYDRLVQQVSIANAAWQFLTPAIADGDLSSGWHLLDLPLRAQLAWQWVEDNKSALVADGYDLRSVAIAIADLPAGTHPLWEHFERVHVRGLRAVFPDPNHWGIGSSLRPLADGLALVNVVDKRSLKDGENIEPGGRYEVYPVILRRSGDHWIITDLGEGSLSRQGNEFD